MKVLSSLVQAKEIKQLKDKLTKEIDSCRFYQGMGMKLRDKVYSLLDKTKQLKVEIKGLKTNLKYNNVQITKLIGDKVLKS